MTPPPALLVMYSAAPLVLLLSFMICFIQTADRHHLPQSQEIGQRDVVGGDFSQVLQTVFVGLIIGIIALAIEALDILPDSICMGPGLAYSHRIAALYQIIVCHFLFLFG